MMERWTTQRGQPLLLFDLGTRQDVCRCGGTVSDGGGEKRDSDAHLYTTHDPIGSYAGVWLDIPNKSGPLHGVAPPFKNYRNSPILRPLREDRGTGAGNWMCGRSQGSPRALQGSCTDR
eukprot:scaffold31391_cov64-Phaeocystis_antarctica.AAC.3